MSNFKIEKTLTIPEVLTPNTIYLLPGTAADTFDIYVSDNTGVSVKNLNIPLPQEPTSRDVGFTRVVTQDKVLIPSDKDTVLRFETNGDKTLSINLSSGFLPNTIFHVSNRATSGDLTITPVNGMYVNPPKGGSLILEPGDTVSLHTVVPSVMDCYGSTAIGPIVPPAPIPVLPGTPQFYSLMGYVFWDPADMTWLNSTYSKAPVDPGDGIIALTNMYCTKLRVTYTNVGLSSFYLLLSNGDSIAFPQRDTGTWTDTIDIPSGVIGIGSSLSANYNDTNLGSVIITNIEIYSTDIISWQLHTRLSAMDSDVSSYGSVIGIGSSLLAVGQPSLRRAFIYEQNGNIWSRSLVLNSDRPSGQYLIEMGTNITVSGNYVAISSTGLETVGLPAETAQQSRVAGVVSLYRHTENDLYDIYNPNPVISAFGISTDIYNNTLIVGAEDSPIELVTIDGIIRTSRPHPGAAYIYALDGSHPVLVQTIENPEPSHYRFGSNVKIYGTFAAIAAQGFNYTVDGTVVKRGKVFIYKLIDNLWTPHSVLTDPFSTDDTVFGYSLALKGTTLVISAYKTSTVTHTQTGAVYIYKLENDQWVLDTTIANPKPFQDADFGDNINLDGDTLTINSYMNTVDDQTGSGSLFVYNKKDGIWSLTAEIVNPLVESWGSFAYRSSIHANFIAVGDLNNNAYIYRLGSLIPTLNIQNVS